ncbi:MAG: putative acetyltransferase [Acidimicrobiaceae bacterium]
MLTIAPEPLDSADARRLISELDAHLNSLYPPEDNFTDLPTADVFLIARLDDVAVGCGAVRFLDADTAEVKRMYVAPAARGDGVGRQLLDELEQFARGRGAQRLVLETGPLQVEALALYERAGFAPTPCWGDYAHGNNSICYEKLLQ